MATNFFKVKKGISLDTGNSGSVVSAEGDVAYNSTSHKLETRDNSATRSMVSEDGTQTLSNKTLDNSTTLTIKDTGLTIQDNSDTSKQAVFDVSSISPSTTRTFNFPNESGTLAGVGTTQTLQNKTLDDTNVLQIKANNFYFEDPSDTSKHLKFSAASISGSTTRTLTAPDANTTIVGTDATQTLTNKTLSGNTATNLVSGSGTLTLNTSGTITVPNGTDTLVGKATSDTLTNKTISTGGTNLIGATTISGATGSGSVVFSASPALTGTPTFSGSSSGTTGLAASATASGTLTLPAATDTLVGKSTTDTLANKTLDNTSTITVKDNKFTIQDDGDTSKQVQFDASGISTSTTRTLIFPNVSDTLTANTATQTLSNKTLDDTTTIQVKAGNIYIEDGSDTSKHLKFSAASISSSTTRTLTAPNADTTIVGTDVAQTLTNKTIDTGGTNLIGATAISGVTGTTNVVMSASPTLTGTTTAATVSATTTITGNFQTTASNSATTGGTLSDVSTNGCAFRAFTGLTGPTTIAGFANPANGKRVVIYNQTTQNLTFSHDDSVNESTAANRIYTMTGANVATTGRGCAELIYDSSEAAGVGRWILLYVTA